MHGWIDGWMCACIPKSEILSEWVCFKLGLQLKQDSSDMMRHLRYVHQLLKSSYTAKASPLSIEIGHAMSEHAMAQKMFCELVCAE